jgi:uncharacterized membrane protein
MPHTSRDDFALNLSQSTRSITEPTPLPAPVQGKPTGERGTLLLGVCIVLLALAVRVPQLGSRGYLLDELWTAELASARGSAHLHLPADQLLMPAPELFHLDTAPPWWRVWTHMECTHPPLYFVSLRLWMNALGEGDATERALSVLCSLVAVALLFDVTRLLHGRAVAIWAGVLMALASPQIDFARQTRNYAMLMMTALLAADALVRIEQFGVNRRRLAALLIGALTALLTHYFCIGAILALGIYALLRLHGRARWQVVTTLVAAAALFAVCWGPFMWQQRRLFSVDDPSTSFLHNRGPGWFGHALEQLALAPARQLSEPRLSMIVTSMVMAVLYLLPITMLARRRELLFWWLWLVGTIGVVAALDFARQSDHLEYVRYFILAGPAVYALIPAMFTKLGNIRWPGHLVPAAAAVMCALVVPDTYKTWITDPHEIISEFAAKATNQDLFVFCANPENTWTAGAQYMMIARYLRPIPCPVVVLHARASDVVRDRALASRRNIVFTNSENAFDFLPLMKVTGAVAYPQRGRLWVLEPIFSRPIEK